MQTQTEDNTCWTVNVEIGERVTFLVTEFTSWNWWKRPLPLTSRVFGLLFPLAWWCARNFSTPSLSSQSRTCTMCSERSLSYSSLWGSLDDGTRMISAPNTPSALWQPVYKLQKLYTTLRVPLYGSETLDITFREEHRLKGSETWVLTSTFGHKVEEVTEVYNFGFQGWVVSYVENSQHQHGSSLKLKAVHWTPVVKIK